MKTALFSMMACSSEIFLEKLVLLKTTIFSSQSSLFKYPGHCMEKLENTQDLPKQ